MNGGGKFWSLPLYFNFYFITRETFDECTCTEDIPYNY